MSIYGAMFSGISGLSAQAQALGMIADNVSNVNTIGYKTTHANFSTLVTQSRTGFAYAPGGVRSAPLAMIDQQGLLQASSSPTDIAISGNGFFVVNTEVAPTTTTGSYMYTRAGSFLPDENGYLRNAAGLYLQGWPMDVNGNIPANRSDLSATEAVNIRSLTGQAEATTRVAIDANLQASQATGAYTTGDMAAGTVEPHFERSIDIYDSLGGSRTLTFGFFKDNALNANEWAVEIYVEPASDVTNTDGLLETGIIAFNTDGSLNMTNTTLPTTLNITTWAPGLGIDDSVIELDFGTDGNKDGITQVEGASQLIASEVNGAIFGQLSGIAINEDGVITALFDNGTRTNIYKLPIATFPNPNGLGNKAGNAYIETDESGNFNLQEAKVGGAGQVASGALEASTVDLATEFTQMITTQRAYSANSRIITTADDMLNELIQIKR